MTTPIAIAALVVKQTAAEILALGLEVAAAVGLPVTTWRTGDPTRTTFKYLARVLESLEDQNSSFISAGFLSSAAGDWLKVLAKDVYGVDAIEATYATPSVTLTNSGTRTYTLGVGDLVARASSTGKTYHSTQAGTWGPGTTLAVSFVADEAGSESSCGLNDVDELVTTFLGLAITGSTASIASDDQDDDSLKQTCEDTRGSLSVAGPADGYNAVVKNPALTGNSEITRAESFGDHDNFTVDVYVAGASGPVSSSALTAAQDAVEQWATPLCVSPAVQNATALPTDLVAAFSGARLPSSFASDAEAAWNTLVSTHRIGATLTLSTINQALRNAVPEADDLTITTPAANVVPAANEVITVSAVTITEF